MSRKRIKIKKTRAASAQDSGPPLCGWNALRVAMCLAPRPMATGTAAAAATATPKATAVAPRPTATNKLAPFVSARVGAVLPHRFTVECCMPGQPFKVSV